MRFDPALVPSIIVDVIATEDTVSMIRDRGGRLFVWLAPGRA